MLPRLTNSGEKSTGHGRWMPCGINDTVFNSLLLSLPGRLYFPACRELICSPPCPMVRLGLMPCVGKLGVCSLGAVTSFHQSSCLCLLCWEWHVSDKVCSLLGKRRHRSTSHGLRAPCRPVADVLWVGKQVCSHHWAQGCQGSAAKLTDEIWLDFLFLLLLVNVFPIALLFKICIRP